MMIRTQISLPAEMHRKAKGRAADRGVSLAEYVRATLAEDLDSDETTARGDISEVFGLFDSGGSDVARHKDEYVADAVRKDYRRKTDRSAALD